MTIPATVSEIDYDGDDVSVAFPIPFAFDTSADLLVKQLDSDGTITTLTTGFTVSGGGGSTGTLTFATAPITGVTIWIFDDPATTQTTDYIDNDAFPAESHERALDRVTRIAKRCRQLARRALRLADGESITDGELADVETRKGKYLFFDAVTGAVTYALSIVGTTLTQLVFNAFQADSEPFKRTATEIAAGITPTNYAIPSHEVVGTCIVDRYGTNTTPGTTDMTTAIQAAITVAKELSAGGSVEFGSSIYKATSTILVDANRIHIRGQGRSATRIVFAPAANDVLFEFHNGASALVRNSLKGMSIYSDDDTFTKTAIDLYDTEEFELDDIEIAGGVVVVDTVYWSGANTIGLRTRGRELLLCQNVQISADRPILISVNPNNSIDCDHANFQNMYLIANANPCVEIETGVELFHTSFSGKQAWVKGTDGLRWIDTTSVGQSIMLEIENVRWEQGTSATAYLVRIEHNTGLAGLKIAKCTGGVDRRGYLLRKCNNVLFESTQYNGTGVAFDVNSTCRAIKGINTFWQASSTATISGQTLVLGSPLSPNSGALRPNFEYDETGNGDETLVCQSALSGISVSIAQDATATIGTTALMGVLLVTTDESVSAIYVLQGAFATTAEIADTAGLFTITANNAATYNIYATGGNYVIQNKRTGTHVVRYLLIGTHAF
jgi:hypothetical protein